MVLFNYSSKELTAKIVYYGPGLGGKTTCLEYIYKSLPSKIRGKMLSLSTQTDRTLFFDFLPMELGKIFGWRIRIQLYTVPGQVFYDATRKVVLKGADGVVFVVDSQKDLLDANIESWQNLQDNLKANNIDFDTIPLIIQYNKRDLKNVLPVEELNKKINTRGVQYFESIATQGKGVMESLKVITKLVLQNLQKQYGKVLQTEEKEEVKAEQEPIAQKATASPPIEKSKTKPFEELSNVEEKMYDKSVLTKYKEASSSSEEAALPYDELANEDIAELPIKDEELSLDSENWKSIQIGKEEKPDYYPSEISASEPKEGIEELEELTIVPEEVEAEESINIEDTQKSKEKLNDTWKTSASKPAQAPIKKEAEAPIPVKAEKIIPETTKEISKEIELSAKENIQQAFIPVEIKLDTKEGLINLSIKLVLSIKLK